MDEYLRKPRRKPKASLHQLESPFPIPIQNITGKKSDNKRWYYYFGNLESDHVSITRLGDLTFLYRLGFFGKGILSRSQPQFEKYKDVLSDQGRKQYMKMFSAWEPEDRVPQQQHFAKVMEERLRQHASWVNKNLSSSLLFGGMEEQNKTVEESVLLPQCADLHTDIDNGLVEECSSDSEDVESFIIPSAMETDISDEPAVNCVTSKDSLFDQTNDNGGAISDNDSNINNEATIAGCETLTQTCSEGSETSLQVPQGESEETAERVDIKIKPGILSDSSLEKQSFKRPLPPAAEMYPEKMMKLEDPYKLYESLQLTFEEAYFLSYGLGCLSVADENSHNMSITEMWNRFSTLKSNFIPIYAAYHHFRSKGWVVRFSKIYGLDFVLYQDGMAFHHASYCVIVNLVHEDTFSQDNPQLTWKQLSSMCRINERAGKEVLFCYVLQPKDMADGALRCPSCIKEFKIIEVVMRRWMPEKYREPSQ